jgi:hypothetical protein
MIRVQMLNNPLQYLKARNAAYSGVAASASDVYKGTLYQIAQSVTAPMPNDDGEITILFKEKGQEKEDSYRGASGQLYTAARGKLFRI